MKLSKMIVLLTLITIYLFAGIAYAAEAPLFPSIYKGTVVDQTGKVVPEGTIKAYINEELKGAIDFRDGVYSRFLVQGMTASFNQPVIFKVVIDGYELEAVSSPNPVLWQSGKISGLDISAIKLTVDLTKLPAVESPTASRTSGSYSGAIQVELSCPTSGAAIYYTTDNSDPQTSTSRIEYSAAISLDKTTMLKTVAVKDGSASAVVTFAYNIVQSQVMVTIDDSSIILKVGGTKQLSVSKEPSDASLQYQSSNSGIVSVSTTGMITAQAVGSATITVTGSKTGMLSNTDIVEVTVSNNPISLSEFPESLSLQIGETEQLSGTAEPSSAAITYASENASIAKVNSSGLVTAMATGTTEITITATKSGYDTSEITIPVVVGQIIATPMASRVSGSYAGTIDVELSCWVSGTTIYYTTNNSDPKTSSSRIRYTGAITLDETTTLKTVAEKNGVFSAIKSFTYTITQSQVQISVSISSTTLKVGGTKQLTVDVVPSNASLQYQSSNTGVVTVSSSGYLTAKAVGTATITVTGSKTGLTTKSDTVTVTVSNNPLSMSVSPQSISLTTGGTAQLNVTTNPTGAAISYASSNLNAAKVSSSGLVTAVGNGTATITITGVKSGYDTSDLTVAVAVSAGQAVLTGTGLTGIIDEEVALSASSFNDIPAGYWAISTINSLAEKGIAGGYQDGSFKPNNTITRAEFTKMLVKALGLTAGQADPAKFSDVAAGKWYFASIQAAETAGLISGDNSGTFRPNANITRQEMAIILVRALGKTAVAQSKASEATTFNDDKTIADWARGYTVTAVQDGLVNGYPADNTFKPENRATRAEACTMIARFLEKKM